MADGSGLIGILAAPISALVGTIIGACAVTLNGVRLENHKRRRDGQSVAVAMAAAIETSIWVIERRGHVATFQWLLDQARAGTPIQVFGAVDENRLTDPVADKLLESVGLLDPVLASQAIKFFTVLYGLRVDILNLREGRLGSDLGFVVRMLEQDLALWQETSVNGKRLSIKLRDWAAER